MWSKTVRKVKQDIAFRKGVRAFNRGETTGSNPYLPSASKKAVLYTCWLEGWHSAREAS